jgi:hypothetical protein
MGIKNSGFSAKSKVSTFNKSQYQIETEVLLIRHCAKHPTVSLHAKKAYKTWVIVP